MKDYVEKIISINICTDKGQVIIIPKDMVNLELNTDYTDCLLADQKSFARKTFELEGDYKDIIVIRNN